MKEKNCAPSELVKQVVEGASQIFCDMQAKGCRSDVVLMNNLINILGEAGKLDDVLKIFGQLETFGFPLNVVTYNIVIKALFKSNAPAFDATCWFEKMKEKGITPSSYTYSILIDGFYKARRLEKTLLLFEEMDEKDFPPCLAAYSLIDALGKSKHYEATNELFQELKENCGSSISRVYAVMIKHIGKRKHIKEEIGLFDEMKRLGHTPNVFSYNALMSGMVRAGMVNEAYSLLRQMQEEGCNPDINSYNIILNGIARAVIKLDVISYNTVLGVLSRAGMFEEAAKVMKEMSEKGFKYDLISVP
ncbi:hypothetical protein AMTRI_Chr02g265320 [Amborella trichopoda]